MVGNLKPWKYKRQIKTFRFHSLSLNTDEINIPITALIESHPWPTILPSNSPFPSPNLPSATPHGILHHRRQRWLTLYSPPSPQPSTTPKQSLSPLLSAASSLPSNPTILSTSSTIILSLFPLSLSSHSSIGSLLCPPFATLLNPTALWPISSLPIKCSKNVNRLYDFLSPAKARTRRLPSLQRFLTLQVRVVRILFLML